MIRQLRRLALAAAALALGGCAAFYDPYYDWGYYDDPYYSGVPYSYYGACRVWTGSHCIGGYHSDPYYYYYNPYAYYYDPYPYHGYAYVYWPPIWISPPSGGGQNDGGAPRQPQHSDAFRDLADFARQSPDRLRLGVEANAAQIARVRNSLPADGSLAARDESIAIARSARASGGSYAERLLDFSRRLEDRRVMRSPAASTSFGRAGTAPTWTPPPTSRPATRPSSFPSGGVSRSAAPSPTARSAPSPSSGRRGTSNGLSRSSER